MAVKTHTHTQREIQTHKIQQQSDSTLAMLVISMSTHSIMSSWFRPWSVTSSFHVPVGVSPQQRTVPNVHCLNPSVLLYNVCHNKPLSRQISMKKKTLRETQTLHAGCSKVEPKFFASPQTPFPGGRKMAKFNQLEMVTTFTYKPSLVKIDARKAISSYRGNRPTNKPTNTQERLQYTAPLSLARSVITIVIQTLENMQSMIQQSTLTTLTVVANISSYWMEL